MTIRREHSIRGVLTFMLLLASLALGAAGPSQAVTTNPVQEPAGGTTAIITVTASTDTATCAPVDCSPTSVVVTLDSNDDNSGGLLVPPSNLKGKTVYLWWLGGAAPTPRAGLTERTDCQRLGAAPYPGVELASGVFDATTGIVSLSVNLPPAGAWDYGPNWLCATTARPGGSGGVGDLMFTITPAAQ